MEPCVWGSGSLVKRGTFKGTYYTLTCPNLLVVDLLNVYTHTPV